jgi:formamidopyrimidine-DNA glycosylase
MDANMVVGVGNIYANESLFSSGIHPLKQPRTLTKTQCNKLSIQVKKILAAAIEQGGTTLKDFVGGDGKPGYFSQKLMVYGRATLPCNRCKTPLEEIRIGQRTTVFCYACQKI